MFGEDKTGIPQVCEAVTFAYVLLAQLKRSKGPLDERDRRSIEMALDGLQKAQETLYGHSLAGPDPSRKPSPQPA